MLTEDIWLGLLLGAGASLALFTLPICSCWNIDFTGLASLKPLLNWHVRLVPLSLLPALTLEMGFLVDGCGQQELYMLTMLPLCLQGYFPSEAAGPTTDSAEVFVTPPA